MATKDSLQAREAECKTLDQLVALARGAITEPAEAGRRNRLRTKNYVSAREQKVA